MTTPGEGDAAMSFDSQSAVNNQGIKDLSIKASFPDGATNLQENNMAHLKTQVPGINGTNATSDSKPQVTDIELPTPTDSAVDSSAQMPDSSAPAAETVVSDLATNGTTSTSAMETDIPLASTVTSAPVPEDPAVQPPVSDSRAPVEPVSQEQAAEIQAQKVATDPVETAVATDAPATSVQDAPSTTEVVPNEAEAPVPAALGDADAMDTTEDQPAETAPALDLPHHPNTGANGDASTSTDTEPTVKAEPAESAPAPAPAAPAEPTPTPASEPVRVKTEVLHPPTLDTEMKDAPPPSPGKMSRSREDDSGLEEPDAKRMRPSSAAGSIMAAGSPVNASGPSSPAPTHRGDRDFASPLTEPQAKAISQVLANTKRSGHSASFAKPVDPVALNIPTYPDIVKTPMDLGTMNEKIKHKQYSNVQAFIDDFNLIVSNCEKFNGVQHAVTANAYKLRETFDKQMNKVPSADYVEPPPPEKKKKITAPRQPARRESRIAAPPPPKTPVAASPTTFSLNPDGVPLIRRDSAVVDGRPKREIHPPAPKDLPYSARPKKKKYQVELRFCSTLLHELDKAKYHAFAHPFKQPVDPVALNIPNYHKVIKKPMDMSSVRKKLDNGIYENAKEFEADVRLIFSNCYKFNQQGDFVYNCGKQLEAEFNAEWSKKDDYVRQNAPEGGAQSASSPEPDDDDDDEEDDADSEEEVEEGTDAIAQLQSQIAAMSQKLNQLKKEPKKKKKQTPPVASKKKGIKKEPKKAEKKSDKKSKKKGATPYVTYEQKQDISNRINTLPEARMMQALEIIKNNMPSLKGADNDELELDIDELSNDVLFKLLQFVKKYAPKPDDDAAERRQSYAPTQPSKPKKNKPMGAKEQESRIEALRRMQSGEGLDEAAAEESSDDEESDDESEEE